MAIDKIKRSFIWLRQVLGIIDKTTLPGDVLGEVRVGMDIFGWDRLAEIRQFDNSGVAAPTATVSGPVTPAGILRVVFHASVVHTDTGVTHQLWIEKQQPTGTGLTGVMNPVNGVVATVEVGLNHVVYLQEGTRLRGRAPIPLVAGALALDLEFIDLPVGEYIQGL